jgi:hypothetical protein
MSRTAKLADLAAAYDSGGGFGFKNRLINGAMTIDQRNAGAAVTVPNDSNFYTVDRWQVVENSGCVLSAEQVEDAPSGFSNSLKLSVTTAAGSIGASEAGFLLQRIEGFNTADLSFGTASAATVTLSYWVKSSITGTFGGSLKNATSNRSYPFSYTINAANTWEQKSVTIAGDTSGTWVGATNGVGVGVTFDIGSGSSRRGTAGAWAASNFDGVTGAVSIVTTLSATFYITGVQLEKGSTATSFDYRPYGTELALCQRYCPVYPTTTTVTPNEELPIAGSGINSTTVYGLFEFPVPTRVPVTGVTVSSASHFTTSRPSTGNIVATAIAFRSGGSQSASINLTIASGGVADVPYFVFANNASARIVFNGAEL